MPFLQAVSVDGFNDLPEQCAEPPGDKSEFLVEGVLQDSVVYVAHQMDQALLLSARQPVVSAIEVAHQHAFETCQDIIQYGSFARCRIDVGNRGEICKYPDVMASAINHTLSLVGMHKGAVCDFFKNASVCRLVFVGHESFHIVCQRVCNFNIENGGDVFTDLLVRSAHLD